VRASAAILLGVVLGACAQASPPASPSPAVIVVAGVLYTDVRIDATCADQPAIRELSGVLLTVRDDAGTVLAQTTTGPLGAQELPQAEGMVGWRAFGCRFAAPWQAELPPADWYTLEARPGPLDPELGFAGIEHLPPQRVSADQLASTGFRWDVEVQPTYVVP
jgi:hypothetical protein